MNLKKKYLLLLSALFCSLGSAQEVKTPAQIQAELDQAQSDFETAKEMFIPWYTGPLITGSADNVPQGKFNIQGYLYFDTTYAQFNDNRKSIDIPNIYSLHPLLLVQYGVTEWLDMTVIGQGFFNWSQGEYAQGWGDTNLTFGLQIVKETPYRPSVRFTIGENFPTGKYERLSTTKNGIDGTGSGAFITVFGINISKVFWQIKLHPTRLRFSGTYGIADHEIGVKDINSYGGAVGTDGDVCLGDNLNLDVGIEVSLTQKWVFAMDIAYTYSLKTTFNGNPGIGPMGLPAGVGGPSSDQLSLAPAIEYNVSSTGGFIGGVWFSVTGRNSANFAAVVLSYTQLF